MAQAIEGNNIEIYRLKVLLKSLDLEMVGLKKRGRSAYSLVKEEFNFKGNKEKVRNQLKEYIITIS